MCYFKYTDKKTIKIKIKPCLKCGKTDIRAWDCGYSSFNVCGITCKNCNRTVKIAGDATTKELISRWNSLNGKLSDKQIIKALRQQIKDMNQEPVA